MTELEISTNKQFKLMSQAAKENEADVLTFSLTNLLECEKQGDHLEEKEVRARRKQLDTSVLLSLQVGRGLKWRLCDANTDLLLVESDHVT